MASFTVRLYRYNPEQDEIPYNQDVEVDGEFRNRMVLDVLEHLKTRDVTLTFRRSCREGVCGSDGLNINGRNGLGCTTRVDDALGKKDILEIRPVPGMPVVRDLVVDQSLFFKQYARVQPWLINDSPAPAIERLQNPEDRAKLDGLDSMSAFYVPAALQRVHHGGGIQRSTLAPPAYSRLIGSWLIHEIPLRANG